MFLPLIIIGVFSEFSDIGYGDMLGSLPVGWPDQWVVAQIDTDSSHYDTVEEISIYFSTSDEYDLSSGYVEANILNFDDTLNCDIDTYGDESYNDYVITCDVADLFTEAGVYGPISFVVRQSADGQILANDVSYGYIALIEAQPDLKADALTVEFDTDDYTVSEDSTLSFSFSLSTGETLYPGDYLVFELDDSFTYETLTFDRNLSTNAADYPEDGFYFDSKGSATIFGLMNEVSGDDSGNFTFTISGFSNPSVVTTRGSYTWTIAVWRYGTNTLLKWISGSGPSDATTTGSVSVVSFAPVHSAIKAATMYSGIVTYMTLTLKADHDIPPGGDIEIVFNGLKVCSYTYLTDAEQTLIETEATTECGVVADDFETYTVASLTTSTILLTTGDDTTITGGTNFKVTILFEATASTIGITSITTSDGTDDIDAYESGFSDITLSGSKLTVAQASIYTAYDDATGVNTAGTTDTHGLGVYFSAPVGLTSGAYKLTIYAPVIKAATAFAANTIGFSSEILAKMATVEGLKVTDKTNPAATQETVTGQTAFVASTSITITNPALPVTSAAEVFAYITSASSGNIFLPGIVTFLKNTPEIVVTLTVGSTIYSYAAPWRIIYQDDLATATVEKLCQDLIIAGMPAKLTIDPTYNFDFTGYTFRFEVVSNIDFTGLGVAVDDEVTVDGATDDQGTIIDTDTLSFTLSKLTTDSTTFTYVLPAQQANTPTSMQVDIYVVDSDDDEMLLTSIGADTAATAESPVTPTDSSDIEILATSAALTSITFSLSSLASSTTYNYAVIYSGDYFVLSSPTLSAGDYNVILGTFTTTAVTHTLAVTVKNTWTDDADDDKVTVAVSTGYTTPATCISKINNVYVYKTGTAATFGTASFTPSTSNSYTYKVPDITLTLTLPIASGSVYAGAVIEITLGSSWDSVEDNWTVTLGGTALTGSLASDVWTSDPLDESTGSKPSLVVKVSGVTLPVIAKGDADQTPVGFSGVTITYDVNADPIEWDQAADDTGSKVKTTIKGVDNNAYTISDESAWIFPDLKSTPDVYFGISFSTNIDLVEGDEINIDASFDDDDDITSNVWCTLGFSDVSISSGILTVVIAEDLSAGDIVTVIKDLAFTPAAAGDIQVDVTVSRDSTDIVDDSVEYSVSTASATVSSFTVDVSNNVPGLSSVHTFTVKLDTDLPAESLIYLDASSGYNIALGDVYSFKDDEEYTMYLWGEDGYFYEVNHWVVTYVTDADYTADSEITFAFEVGNPSASGQWSVYVAWGNGTVIASDQSDAIDFTSEITNDIDVYFANPDFSDDLQTHSLDVEAFIGISATAESEFTVMFPAPYNLEFYESSSVKCSLTLAGVDVTLSSTTCPVSDNTVTFTLSAATEFADDSWAVFTIEELTTPKWGFTLNLSTYEYDDYSTWTGRFCVGYNEKDSDLSSLSFDNLNGAYFGFEVVYISYFEVNEGNTIYLTPGTYSGSFSVVPVNYEDGELSDLSGMLADQVVLTATAKSYDDFEFTIEFSDDATYTLDFFNPEASFWIGASSATPEGIYYIQWNVDETPYEGEDEQYVKSFRSKLEVSSANMYTIEVEIQFDEFYIPPSGYSFPYKVFITQDELRGVSPYEDITLTFVDPSGNVSFYPEDGLVISAFETEGYIYASCYGCEAGSTYDITVDLSDNANAFMIDDFTVIVGSPYTAEAEFELSVPDDSISSSGFEVYITSNSWAVVTWFVISEDIYNDDLAAYTNLTANTYNLGSSDDEAFTLEEYIQNYEDSVDAIYEEYDDYEDISVELILLARSVYFVGQTLVSDDDGGVLLQDFSGLLVPSSTYTVGAFVDNYWDANELPPFKSVDVTTDDALPACTIDITGDLVEADIVRLLSQSLDIAQEQILYPESDRRRLSTATVTLISGVSDTSSASSKVTSLGTAKLASQIGADSVSDPVDISAATSAEWDGEPFWDEIDDGVVTFNYTTTVSGYLYCVTEINTTYTSEYSERNIRFGLDRNGDSDEKRVKAKVSVDNYEYTFYYNETGYGVYDIACIVCDDYPITPTCSSIKNYTLDYSDSSSSGAVALVMAVAAYLLI